MDRPEHSIAVTGVGSPGPEPEQFIARCSCGWSGTGFTGQEARRAAEADGQEHLMRAQRSADGYDPRWPADD